LNPPSAPAAPRPQSADLVSTDSFAAVQSEVVVSTFVTQLVRSAVERLMAHRDPKSADPHRHAVIEDAVSVHLRYLAAWSARVQIFGMRKARDLLDTTVSLSLRNDVRWFRTAEHTEDAFISEADLLSMEDNIILAADPGAGKTTTLKRITQHLLTAGPANGDDIGFPVAILCKEHDWTSTHLVLIWLNSSGYLMPICGHQTKSARVSFRVQKRTGAKRGTSRTHVSLVD